MAPAKVVPINAAIPNAGKKKMGPLLLLRWCLLHTNTNTTIHQPNVHHESFHANLKQNRCAHSIMIIMIVFSEMAHSNKEIQAHRGTHQLKTKRNINSIPFWAMSAPHQYHHSSTQSPLRIIASLCTQPQTRSMCVLHHRRRHRHCIQRNDTF